MKQNKYSQARWVIFDHPYTNLAKWNQYEYATVEENAPEDDLEPANDAALKEEIDDSLCENGTLEEQSNMQSAVSFPEESFASKEARVKPKIEILENILIKQEMVGNFYVNESEVCEEHLNSASASSFIPKGYQNTFEKFVKYQKETDRKRSAWQVGAVLKDSLLNADIETNCLKRTVRFQCNKLETTKSELGESNVAQDKRFRQLNSRLNAKKTENLKLKNKIKLLEEQKKLDYMKILSHQIAIREYEHWCANLADKLRTATSECNLQKAELSKMKYLVKVMSKSGKYNRRLPLIPYALQRKLINAKLGIKSGPVPVSTRKERRGTKSIKDDQELRAMKEELTKLKGRLNINSVQNFECISLL